jgi:hypothetical protein
MGDEKTIVIVEPEFSGHHFYFVSLLVRHFLARHRDFQVTLLTSKDALDSPEFGMHLSGYPINVRTFANELENLDELQSLPEIKSAATVYFPYGDPWLLQMFKGSWRLEVPCNALVIRCDPQVNSTPGLGQILALVKKSIMMLTNTRKNVSISGLKSSLQKKTFPIKWIDDPVTIEVDEQQLLLMRTKIAERGPKIWIGVYGHISNRKNLDLILQSVLNNSNWGLIVSGKIDDDVYSNCQEMLNQLFLQGRLVLETGPTTDSQFNANIMASDYVAVAHSTEGPSAVFMKAIHLKRKALAAGAKSLKKEARHAGPGAIWTKLTISDVSNGFERLAHMEPSKEIAPMDPHEFGKRICDICA